MPKVSGFQISKRYMDQIEDLRNVAVAKKLQPKLDKRITMRGILQGVLNLGMVNEKNLKEVMQAGFSGVNDADETDAAKN